MGIFTRVSGEGPSFNPAINSRERSYDQVLELPRTRFLEKGRSMEISYDI
jgi:hypothetical protein